jgi:bacterioferritin
MKGKPEVLEMLSMALSEELAAIDQYIVHAEMQENWGYEKLSKLIKMQSIGEMKHAEALIERILFLEGIPQMDKRDKIYIGKDVKQQLQNDLKLEQGAVASYNKAVEVCRKAGDNASADFMKDLLKDEEGHVDFLETQLGLIDQLGYENYLVEQMGEGEGK